MNYPSILMIRPWRFGFNTETAENNEFQHSPEFKEGDRDLVLNAIANNAMAEFDAFVTLLQSHNVDVIVFQDNDKPWTPDSIYPNNWFSTHSDGTFILYPMYAENRRAERKPVFINQLEEHFHINRKMDYSFYENEGKFLESTGSMIFDHSYRKIYANISERTHPDLVQEISKELGYKPVIFNAYDQQNKPIYHTNVLMCMGEEFVLICLDAIPEKEKVGVIKSFQENQKEIIDIDFNQLINFCGNMLQIKNRKGENLLVMSEAAFQALNIEQIQTLEKYNTLVHTSLSTIEKYGGGSARCMLAEIFLNRK